MLKRKLTAGLLALALVVCAVLPTFNQASAAEAYDDFDPGAWYAQAVNAAVENGLLRGVSATHLNPNGYLTRAEMAAIINRAFGAYKTTDISQFMDVKRSDWFYVDLQKAVQMGTYQGTSNHALNPNASITRQEVMTVMSRALCLDLDRYSKISLSHFKDSKDVSIWAIPYVRAMVGAGYISGRGGNELAPVEKITRAEFAQMMYNAIGGYVTESGTYKSSIRTSMLIRTDDVRLEGMAVNGDLYIGSGVGDGEVYLSNVTVNGRIVVWGGGVNSVYLENTSSAEELVVCRVDGPVRVVFDEASTKAVKDVITIGITEKANSFEQTEVVFWEDKSTNNNTTNTTPPDPPAPPVVEEVEYTATIVDVLGNSVTGFDVTSGNNAATITLPAMSKVIPMVITISSDGAVQANVTVTLKDNSGNVLGTGTTNANGKVTLPKTTGGLSDEDGSIIVIDGVNIYKITVKNKVSGTPIVGASVSINSSKLITVKLPVGADNTIALITVTNEKNVPYANQNVAMTTSSGEAKGSGTTDTNGKITLPNNQSGSTDPEGWVTVTGEDGKIYKVRVQDKITLSGLQGANVSIESSNAIKVLLPTGKDDTIALITVVNESSVPYVNLAVSLATSTGTDKGNGVTDAQGQIILPNADNDDTDDDGWAVIIDGDGNIYRIRVQDKLTMTSLKGAKVSIDDTKAIQVLLPEGKDNAVALITVTDEERTPRASMNITLATSSGIYLDAGVTDSQGQVTLPKNDTGSTDPDGWVIIVDQDGNIYKVRVQDNDSKVGISGATVSIDAAKDLTVTMPSAKDSAVALITVLAADDSAVAGMDVRLLTSTATPRGSDITDSNGQVVLPKPVTGTTDPNGDVTLTDPEGNVYKVSVKNNDTMVGISGATVILDVNKAISVALPAGEDNTVALITVTDDTDAARVNVSVALSTNDGSSRGAGVTDSNGQIILPKEGSGTTDGNGDVTIIDGTGKTYKINVRNRVTNAPVVGANCVVTNSGTVEVTLPTGFDDTIARITVTDEADAPYVGQPVALFTSTAIKLDEADTNAQGQVVLPRILSATTPDNGTIVLVDKSGNVFCVTVQNAVTLTAIANAVVTVDDYSNLTVALPAASDDVITLVTVADENSNPVLDKFVTLVTSGGTEKGSGLTNSNGQIVLPKILTSSTDPNGTGTLVDKFGNIYVVTVKNRVTGIAIVGATLTLDDTTGKITTTLPAGQDDVTALITVVDPQGSPYSGVDVSLNTNAGTEIGNGQTDSNGRVVLPDPTNGNTDGTGTGTLIGPDGKIYVVSVKNKLTGTGIAGATLKLEATDSIRVTMPSGSDDVIALITVTDENHTAKANVYVTLDASTHATLGSGVTDLNGRVTLPTGVDGTTDNTGRVVVVGPDGTIYDVTLEELPNRVPLVGANVSINNAGELVITLPNGKDDAQVQGTVRDETGMPHVNLPVVLEQASGTTVESGLTDNAGTVILPAVNAYQQALNQQVSNNQISVELSADILATVGSKEVRLSASNNSSADTYVIEIRRNDTGDLICAPITLAAGQSVSSLNMYNDLPYGNYECTATITATRNGNPLGTLKLTTTVYVAYLWAT